MSQSRLKDRKRLGKADAFQIAHVCVSLVSHAFQANGFVVRTACFFGIQALSHYPAAAAVHCLGPNLGLDSGILIFVLSVFF